ncbi:MAG: hypothetical protein LIP77_07495, partial [Planctomycetes bacterium]|nr:hypothetical protein [Planctomycetota bacterium]
VYTRDLRGRVTGTVYPGGAEERVEWDAAGRMASHSQKITADTWQTTRYEYDRRGETVAIIYPSGTRKTFERDAAGRVVRTVIDPDGLNITESYTYDLVGYLTAVTDALGHTSRYSYDEDGNLVRIHTAGERHIAFRYDAAGRLVERVADPDGDPVRETYTIDPRGRVASLHNGLTEPHFSYDDAGRLIGETRPGRADISYGYDAAGRVDSLIRRHGKEEIAVSARYDALGRALERTDALGNRIEFQYNMNGELTGVLGPTGGRASLTWGPDRRLQELALPENRRYRYTYDLTGNLVRAEGGPSGPVEYRYNAAGQRVAVRDANGRERQREYDAAGRLVAMVNEMGYATKYSYDAAGNLLSLTDANGNVTSYAYDADGLRVSLTYPAVEGAAPNIETYRYDGSGRLVSKTTPNGTVISYRYQAAGMLAAVYTGEPLPADEDIPDSRLLVRYERDAAGKVVREIVAGGGLEFDYDGFGRLRRSRDRELDRSVEYDYDRRNRQIGMRILEHSRHGDRVLARVGYTYDRSGRLTSVSHDDEPPARYHYDEAGRRTRLELPNGVATDYVYNQLDRLTSLRASRAGEPVVSFASTYYAAGNRTGTALADGSRIEYLLDQGYRLLGERRLAPDGTPLYEERFSYDPGGNRLTRESSLSGPATYFYNARNQLTGVADGDGRTAYHYDANGNLVAEEGAREAAYTYDVLDRLVRADGPDGAMEADYYGGLWRRRATRLVRPDGEVLEFRHLYDRDDITADFRVEPDGRARTDRVYVTPFLDDNLSLAEYGGPDRKYFYYLRDGLGSVRAVTDAAGRVRSQYDYTAFGETYNPGVVEEMWQRYGYTGRERIGPSTVLGYRNRQYHPALGRFNQRDPAGTAGGINLYGYVENQPSRYVDPYGLWLTDTHVEIQLQAIREVFGLECDKGCPPSIKATFRAAHAWIDNPVIFILNPEAHALTSNRWDWRSRHEYPNSIPQAQAEVY